MLYYWRNKFTILSQNTTGWLLLMNTCVCPSDFQYVTHTFYILHTPVTFNTEQMRSKYYTYYTYALAEPGIQVSKVAISYPILIPVIFSTIHCHCLIITYSVLQHVHTLFKSEFLMESNLVLLPLISSILSFP